MYIMHLNTIYDIYPQVFNHLYSYSSHVRIAYANDLWGDVTRRQLDLPGYHCSSMYRVFIHARFPSRTILPSES